jgi:hypothetical protein
MLLQPLRRLFKGFGLQVKGNNLSFGADSFGQDMSILSGPCGQVNSQVAMVEDFTKELMTPGDDAG